MQSSLIFLVFVGISISKTLSYEWNSKESLDNVRIFAEFMDDLYKDYEMNDKMDTIVRDPSTLFPAEKQINYSAGQKRTVFNLTFVKCVAEIAYFRVINENDQSKDAFLEFKVVPGINALNEFLGFLHFDQSLGQQIAHKFKSEFFSTESPLAESVVNQVMQLAFSFAARVILCIIYEEYYKTYHDFGGWQLKTLLVAFKKLSKRRGKNNENGTFPFQIIQKNGKNHFWIQNFLSQNAKLFEYNSGQTRFIGNFEFILKLSDFKLTQYEISDLLEGIMNKATLKKKSEDNALILKKKSDDRGLIALLSSRISSAGNADMDCALISFGRELEKRLRFVHHEFRRFTDKSEKQCGRDPHSKHKQPFIGANNTPAEGSKQIEMKIFGEPLWNYARVIEIDTNDAKVVVQFCEDLQMVVNFTLNFPIKEPDNKFIGQMKNWKDFELLYSNRNEYELLYSVIRLLEYKDNRDALEIFSKNFDDFDLKQMDEFFEFLINFEEKYLNDFDKKQKKALQTFCKNFEAKPRDVVDNLYKNFDDFNEKQRNKLKIFFEKLDKKYLEKLKELKESLSGHLLEILKNIHTDYTKASQREASKNGGILLTNYGKEMLRFGQILYETMKKNLAKNMEYDEKKQLLTFTLSFAKHLLGRLFEFVERNFKENFKVSDDMDFVQTIRAVASNNEELVAEKRQKSISAGVNVKLSKLLFSLAIRLCLLIDGQEFREKYVPKFVFALKMCSTNTGYTKFYFFKYKMEITQQSVGIYLPNWNLPYYVYKENEKELKMEKEQIDEIVQKIGARGTYIFEKNES